MSDDNKAKSIGVGYLPPEYATFVALDPENDRVLIEQVTNSEGSVTICLSPDRARQLAAIMTEGADDLDRAKGEA